MRKPESALENLTHKDLLDFEIQPDDPIPTRKPDRVFIYKKKRNCHLTNLVVSVDNWVKIVEYEKIDKYLDLAREL